VDPVTRLVERFDHHDPALARDPYSVYRGLREGCPVSRSEAWGGMWVAASYEHVTEIANDDETYSSAQGVSLPPAGNPRPLIPIEIDPPELFHYRRLLNPLFSPAAVAQMEPAIRATAVELIEALLARGEGDLMRDLAEPVPARTTLRFLGLDEDQWARYLHAVTVIVHESSRDFERAMTAFMDVAPDLMGRLAQRRADGGAGEDFISLLVRAEVEGRPLGDEQILDMCFLQLTGGLHTTAAAIGSSLLYLARHPAERDRLAAEPERIPVAVEELLRHQSPVQGLARTVTRDTVLGGQQLCAGDKVWVLWGSANRDEKEFPDAETVDLDRNPNRHVAFGVGAHRCLGLHLGRLETRVVLEEVLRRMPGYEIGPDAEANIIEDCSVVYTLTSLPCRVTPV
jgi:cytochrome P450